MRFDYQFLLRHLPGFAPGVALALYLFASAAVVAMVCGLFLGLGRLSHRRLPFLASTAYVEFFRNTPSLIQIYFVFFGLPLMGVRLSLFTSGVVALAAQHSAFFAEIYRGAVQGISINQIEGGTALGMRWRDVMVAVVLPQAFRDAIPAIGNQLVLLLLDTSIVSTVGMMEITWTGLSLAEKSAASFESLVGVGAIYLVLSTIVSMIIRRLEHTHRVVR